MANWWQGRLKFLLPFKAFLKFLLKISLYFNKLSYPVVFLVGSLLTTALLGLGLVSFHEEHDLTKVERR